VRLYHVESRLHFLPFERLLEPRCGLELHLSLHFEHLHLLLEHDHAAVDAIDAFDLAD
jgi:hypothetical protein